MYDVEILKMQFFIGEALMRWIVTLIIVKVGMDIIEE